MGTINGPRHENKACANQQRERSLFTDDEPSSKPFLIISAALIAGLVACTFRERSLRLGLKSFLKISITCPKAMCKFAISEDQSINLLKASKICLSVLGSVAEGVFLGYYLYTANEALKCASRWAEKQSS